MRPVGTLRNVVGEGIDGNLFSKDGILCINNLSTDQEFDIVDELRPIWVIERRVVIINGEIGVAEKITSLLEADG